MGEAIGGVWNVRYDRERFLGFSDEDKEYCYSKWREKAKANKCRYMVVTLIDDEIFGEHPPEQVYREDIVINDRVSTYAPMYDTMANTAWNKSEKDQAYLERNILVRAFASLFANSYIAKTDIEGWDEEWHWCCYIHITGYGQFSWHFHESQLPLFTGLPIADNPKYDGHTTEDKYARLLAYTFGKGRPLG